MNNFNNLQIYQRWAPLYDLFFTPLFARARKTLIEGLGPKPHEHWLIPGVGTGQDLDFLPSGSVVVAGDLSPAMLAKAIARFTGIKPGFHYGDAQHLPFAEATFDGIVLSLLLSVVPDGQRTFQEAWRVLKPGGRIGIFDKFLSAQQTITPIRHAVGAVMRGLGTDPNRRLEDLIYGMTDLEITKQQPSLLAGQYQLIWLHKRAI